LLIADGSTLQVSLNIYANTGNLTLSGPTSSFASLNWLDTNAGSLTFTQGRSFTTKASLTNTGSITLGPNSTLHVTGALTNPGTISLNVPAALLQLDATTSSDVRAQILANHLTSNYPDPNDLFTLAYSFSAGPQARVQLTYIGDANLDGLLNADDYALLDRGFAKSLSDWSNGDFNYDGTINNQDYLLIDRAYILRQAQGFSPGFLAQRQSQFGTQYISQLLTSLPEPSLLLCLPPIFPLSSRRRTATPRLP
jgi:hypothetical protein